MLLSILIATVPERELTYNMLTTALLLQRGDNEQVEILVDSTPRTVMSIGRKRNDLLNMARGEYIVFFDDDDLPMPNYIELILKAIEARPDCVDINILMLTNGMNPQICQHHRANKKWHSQSGIYYRNVTQFNPVRRELALQTGFKDLRYAEDRDYADRLTPLCLTSVLIPEIIYIYNYSNKEPHEKKYGIR